MKEPYGEGVATRTGPESCADAREGGGEAWTGGRAGRGSSRGRENGGPHREVGGRTPMTNGHGKSDGPVVPGKSPNKAGGPVAEAMEGRGLAKGNPSESNAPRTQSRTSVPSALERVRQAA